MIQSSRHIAQRVGSLALLLLAVCVFSLGLQAKLSLYKDAQRPSVVSASKLSIEERSGQVALILDAARSPEPPMQDLMHLVTGVHLRPAFLAWLGVRQGGTAIEAAGAAFGSEIYIHTGLSSRPPPFLA